MIGPFGGTADLTAVFFVVVMVVGALVALLSYEFWGRGAWWFGLGLVGTAAVLLLFRALAGGMVGPFGGNSDALLIGVVAAVSIGLVFLLLTHELDEQFGHITFWAGVGLIAAALLLIAIGQSVAAMLALVGGGVIVALLLQVAPRVLLHYAQFRYWGHGAWWGGLALLVAALVMLGLGRTAPATALILAGVVVLWVLALVMPQVTRRYTQWEEQWTVTGEALSVQDRRFERSRYTTLAMGTLALVGVVAWVGGVPAPREDAAEVQTGPLFEFTVDAEQATRGQVIFLEYGCQACHNVESRTGGVGPSLVGIFAKMERLERGEEVLVDEEYLRESIVDPNAKIVRGYQGAVMMGGIQANHEAISQPETVNALVEFIKSLAN